MRDLKVKVVNISDHELPCYQTPLSAGMDLVANNHLPIAIDPGDRALIPTGLFIELPEGYEAQIRPRSGLALKHGVTVLNAPGTVDADYRGEIKVLLVNLGNEQVIVNNGDRIAQMVIARHEHVSFIETTVLSGTDRQDGGFGSTGIGI